MEIERNGWGQSLRKNGFAAVAFRTLAAWACAEVSNGMSVATGCCSCFTQMGQAEIVPVYNPHHADVLIVNGAVSNKAAAVIRRLYDQMPTPKYVIAFGNCAINGGMFAGSYAVTDVRKIVPVDVCVEGCPPSVERMKAGVEELRRLIYKTVKAG